MLCYHAGLPAVREHWLVWISDLFANSHLNRRLFLLTDSTKNPDCIFLEPWITQFTAS